VTVHSSCASDLLGPCLRNSAASSLGVLSHSFMHTDVVGDAVCPVEVGVWHLSQCFAGPVEEGKEGRGCMSPTTSLHLISWIWFAFD